MNDFNKIHPSFQHGENLSLGYFCVIEENVSVGNNVRIDNHVLLKAGTTIGDNCHIDSYVISSGNNNIGNNVSLRYQSIVARNVIIEDNVFFSAGVKTVYLDHKKEEATKTMIIRQGCFLGDSVVVMHGVEIAENCVIGANALVTKNTKPNGVYVGSPARRIRDI